ncbi:hypothetical protein ACOSQ2_004544 [Xanthoceras sorbifolium]
MKIELEEITNVLFSINASVVQIMMGLTASRVISPQQDAFIPGKHISECIGMVSEATSVLNAFGFHPTFVAWVKAILESARVSILVNEDVLSRGISALISYGSMKSISSHRGCVPPTHVLFTDDHA